MTKLSPGSGVIVTKADSASAFGSLPIGSPRDVEQVAVAGEIVLDVVDCGKCSIGFEGELIDTPANKA